MAREPTSTFHPGYGTPPAQIPTTKTQQSAPVFEVSLSVYRGDEMRLDVFLHRLFPDLSRGRIGDWICQGQVSLKGRKGRKDRSGLPKPATKVKKGEEIQIRASLPEKTTEDLPESMQLDVRYEDEMLLVVNKPPELVTHPGAGNPNRTLLNGLLAYREEQKFLPRAGLIHRLDKGTGGLLMVAKDHRTHLKLQRNLTKHLIAREYLALAEGRVISGGCVNMPIGRDKHHRKKMRAYPVENAPASARTAITHYRVKERFVRHTLLHVSLETGRTHQIRCHLSAIGFRICGDPLYGRRPCFGGADNRLLQNTLDKIDRQMLHACSLSFPHPQTKKTIRVTAELPQDMSNLLAFLRQHQVSS